MGAKSFKADNKAKLTRQIVPTSVVGCTNNGLMDNVAVTSAGAGPNTGITDNITARSIRIGPNAGMMNNLAATSGGAGHKAGMMNNMTAKPAGDSHNSGMTNMVATSGGAGHSSRMTNNMATTSAGAGHNTGMTNNLASISGGAGRNTGMTNIVAITSAGVGNNAGLTTNLAVSSAVAGHNVGLADQMTAIHNSILGHLELCPKCVRKFVDEECNDKFPHETYKDYCERLQGSFFDYGKWKKLCSFSWRKFETDTSPNDMDVTALGHLFYVLFKTKNDSRDTSAFMKKLQTLKNLRNGVMHSIKEASDPAVLVKLEAALDDFIKESGRFYSLPANEVQSTLDEMRTDIRAQFSPGTKQLLYAKACMVSDGLKTVEFYVKSHFGTENLLFNMGQVERTAVFHELEVMIREHKNGKSFPYSKIFEHTEKFIVVSGLAGAGKSTLLQNIALQFIKRRPGTSARLQDFELLVYIECRDRTTPTLSDVIKQQFVGVRTKLGEDLVLDALIKLRVLYLVDGFDEYSHGMTVLQEVFKKTQSQADCQVVITTRPHAVAPLKKLLRRENANDIEFEIAQLEKLEQQLNFLEKFEPHLLPHRPSVQESFQTLEEPLRRMFTEPLKLLQFCNICITYPERIAKWKRMNDVSKDVFNVYKDRVAQKIADTSYADIDYVIDDLFLAIYETALTYLRLNALSFTEEQFRQIGKECRSKLQSEHIMVDPKLVLSCVFKMIRPRNDGGNPIYTFHHKTDQEYFAAKGVVEKMKSSNLCLKDILGMNSPIDNSCMEVLLYVTQDISADSPKLFEKRWSELKEALREAGATFRTWCDLVLSSSDDVNVVMRAAEAAKNLPRSKWNVRNGREMDAVTLMLPHHQPAMLDVMLRPEALRKTRWAEVARLREGDLWLEMGHDEPCDDLLEPLRNSDGRPQPVLLRGAIAEAASVETLSSVAVRTTALRLHLLAPMSLSALQGRCAMLSVSVRPFGAIDEGSWPSLPADPCPILQVTDVQLGAWEDVIHTVQILAPDNKRYVRLELQSCDLSESELDRTVAALQQGGVRTWHSGPTSWRRDRFGFKLLISDELPERLALLVRDYLAPTPSVPSGCAICPQQTGPPFPADVPCVPSVPTLCPQKTPPESSVSVSRVVLVVLSFFSFFSLVFIFSFYVFDLSFLFDICQFR